MKRTLSCLQRATKRRAADRRLCAIFLWLGLTQATTAQAPSPVPAGIVQDGAGLALMGEARAFGGAVNLGGAINVSDGVLGAVPAAVIRSPCPGSKGEFMLERDLGVIRYGLATVNVTSDIDGLPGLRFSMSNAQVRDVVIELPRLISLRAQSLHARAGVINDLGTINFAPQSVIEGLSLNGIPVYASKADANVEIFNQGGVRVLLNEQSQSDTDITVNALHVSFANASLGGQRLDGEIIVAHSFARLMSSSVLTPEAQASRNNQGCFGRPLSAEEAEAL